MKNIDNGTVENAVVVQSEYIKDDENITFKDEAVNSHEPAGIQSHVDAIEGGTIHGWAYDPERPGSRLLLQAFSGNELLGETRADKFRHDLLQAGKGDGVHAFELKIKPPGTKDATSEQFSIMLLEAETGQAIADTPMLLNYPEAISFQFHELQWGHLQGEVRGEVLDSDHLGFNLVDSNGVVIGQSGAVKKDVGVYQFNIPVPRVLCDGQLHALTVSLLGEHQAEATYVDVFPSILTPWEHLASSAKKLNYSALSRTAGYRYDSLQRQIHAHSGNGKLITDIIAAHGVVVTGYEGRKEYPVLSLPEVESPDVTIVIPVHNKFALTYHSLAALILAHNEATYEVIVVDDCSTDKTTELDKIVENVRIITNEHNLGFLRNCNKAVQEANGDFVVMLNNDTEVTSGWLDEMIDTFNRFDGVGMVGSKLIYPDGKLQEAGGIVWGNGQPWNLGNRGNSQAPEWNYARQVDYLSGASLMLPRTLWNEVNGFSDEFAPAYYEDTDLAFKIRDSGYKTVYAPYSIVVHFEGMSNGRDESQGIKKHQAINAPRFRSKWVDSYMHNGEPNFSNVSKNKDRGIAYRVLMIDHAVPRPDHDAGSYAAVQEIRMLQANGFKVSFVAENMAHMGKYTDELQKMGVECFYSPFQTSVSQVLETRGSEYDVVYITRYDVAERHLPAVKQYTRAKVLFNNADLHFLRELRAALAAGQKDLSGPLATRDRELALMRKVDGILSYNPTEHAVIMSHNLQVDNLHICPWVLDGRGHKTPYQERSGIAFLGGYRHTPNVEAVEFFVEKVMPQLRKRLPGVAFHIYGSAMPESFNKYASEDVILEGFVENLDDVFESARVMIAPLLSGAGIKGKVLEGMSAGIPQVLTPVAAEATGLTHGVSAMIVEEPLAWVEAIVEVYEDEHRWQQVSDNALTLARTNFSFDTGIKGMAKTLESIGVYAPNHKKSLIS
ncbi:glycosyltransferase [Cobetia crustatorum]|uniref:Glycosyltransferase n=1 Tax=Cobetia crustatorum TaxID=553385 RepID=A0A558HQ86_9GAMM|nr:glycosyltransferase [Cobetia crustatorum]TVU71287.1 glycosyltransferase [Cobetia crustatorum]